MKESALMERDSTIRVEAVLADRVYEDVEQEITDKKQTSSIIRELNVQYPLPEFNHLKRVKGGEIPRVLVCRLESQGEDEQKRSTAQLESLRLRGLGVTSVVWVPRLQPITRTQYNKASGAWPTHFHEDKVLEKALRQEMFSPQELCDIRKFLETALALHKTSGNDEFSSSMILVDPDTKQVIAQATTDISHPLKHATMLCLDQLASVRGGGAWDKKDSPLSREGGLQKEGVATERGDCPPAKRPKLQYLCTGYDAYCSAEPCIMCSMALLHSRIGHVFFCYTNPSSGGLYSQYKIHTHTKLNHHFKVYRCTLEH